MSRTDFELRALNSGTPILFCKVLGLPASWYGSDPSPFGYAGAWGYQTDASSGLMLLGNRYYDPSTGRFLTRDPAQDGRNWYVYVDGNPLNAVDPEGLQVFERGNPFYEFMIGMGDGVSFGLTKLIRDRTGTSQYTDEDSGWHFGGELTGEVVGTYVAGAGAGKVWRLARGGRALRLGGAGTRASHLIRIERGTVQLIPGVRKTGLQVLHGHVNIPGLGKLHLPYQLWPAIQGGRLVKRSLRK